MGPIISLISFEVQKEKFVSYKDAIDTLEQLKECIVLLHFNVFELSVMELSTQGVILNLCHSDHDYIL